jgi:hypothetical protein
LLRVVGGYLILNSGMTPDAIVEHLDVLKYNLLCVITGFKFEVMQAFRFERAKKTFHWGIVPTVAFTTHGRFHFVTDLQCSLSAAAILAAAVRVVE